MLSSGSLFPTSKLLSVRAQSFSAPSVLWLSTSLRGKAEVLTVANEPRATPLTHTLTSALPLSAAPTLLEPCWPHTPASGSLLWLFPLPGILLPQIFPLLMSSIKSLFKCHIAGQTVFLAAWSSHSLPLTLLCWSHQHPHHLKHCMAADSNHLLECKLHEGRYWFFLSHSTFSAFTVEPGTLVVISK